MLFLANEEHHVRFRAETTAPKKTQILLIICLTIVFLALAVNPSLPFEQDQGSKAAKILYMVRSNTIFEPLAGPRFYRDELFSLYYIISALVYRGAGGDIFTVMNWLSVFMGIIFFPTLSILLNKAVHTNCFANWVVFVSMPILTTTFLYGNEVAFSITFFVLSLVFLTFFHSAWARVVGALLVCAAVFCRPDITLLIPFWIGWYLWLKRDSLTKEEKRRDVLELLVVFLSTTLIYWLIFIRRLELHSLSFEYETNLRLFLAYIVYPFNVTSVLIGVLSLSLLTLRRQRVVLLLLCLTLPVIFYLRNLSSPKYIIGLALFFGIPTVIFLDRLSYRKRVVAFASIFVWFFTSVTPYGINHFGEGAALFIPTADGPIPSGSYFWFYKFLRDGFYSAKYKGEIESARRMIHYIGSNAGSDVVIVGRFNDHFLLSELATSPYYDDIAEWRQKWYADSFPERQSIRYIMPQRAYLSINNMSEQIQGMYFRFLREGRVRSIATAAENDAFPFVIEIGDAIPPNTDLNLARRILFVYKYYGGEGIMSTSIDPQMYRPTYWLPTNSVMSIGAKPIYADEEWKCYTRLLPDSQIWVTELPVVYASERDPNE